MASSSYPHRNAIHRDVLISRGDVPCHCMVWIDADCWTPDSRPNEIGGVLDVSRDEWEGWASADRLIMTLCETGEPYRMILDGYNGRFVARKL